MFSFKGKSKDLGQMVSAAQAAAGSGRAAEAEGLLRQVVQSEPTEENRAVLAQAALDLGAICEHRNAVVEALQCYGTARSLGAALTPAAWTLLAESYAEQQSQSDYALGAYLAYIQDRAPELVNGKVAAALETACRVDENHVSDDRKRAAEFAKRVIAANGGLEWPYYHLAVAYLQDGDLPAAMVNLVRAQKRNPNRAMTYYWMGACHLRQASATAPPAAMDWFAKFLAFPPDSPDVAELQASVALEMAKRLSGNIAAIPYLEIAIARDPSNLEARQRAAQAALDAGRYADAEAHAQAAIGLGGRQPSALGPLIDALYRQNKFPDVIAQWERGPLPEAGPETMFLVARSYSQIGKFEAALESLNKLPRDARAQYYSGCAEANLGRNGEAKALFQVVANGGGDFSARAWTQLGAIFLREGDIGGAGDAYDRALGLDPNDEAALYGMGSLAYRMKELGVAAECFSKILEHDPNNVRARFAMGATQEAQGETAAAIACYEAVAKPMDAGIRLGVLYCRARRFRQAAEMLEPLYGSGFESDAVLYYLGMAYAGLERYGDAVEAWNRLLARHPDREIEAGLATLYLAQALRQWDSRESEALLDQALVHDPCNLRGQYFRALYDWKRGRMKEAKDRLREIAGQSDDPRALYHLGLCLAKKGAYEEAAPYFERAAQRRDNDYGLYAAWAIANQHIRQGRYQEAEAILAGLV